LHTTQAHLRAISALTAIICALALASAGCSRNRYYTRADKEAKYLVQEKSNDPRWAVPPGYTIDMDPRSRFRDCCNEVFPPMPPDDPAAHVFMHCVDGMKGFPFWHKNGDRMRLDNPGWRAKLSEFAEVTDDGRIKLTLDSAVRLAYLNSSNYQYQLETLYLSALDVSTERFRFATQFFGTNETSYTSQGPLNSAGEASTLQTDTSFWFERKFATAGELVVGVANSIVWQFAGPEQFSDVSIINFNLVQPLLRNAGRAVALEQLTIVERALLAGLRQLQLYRQGFFASISIGDGVNAYVQRRGGFTGSTGLTGFSGSGVGGFGGYYNTMSSGAAAGGGAGTLGGFVGLLQSQQQIRNSEHQLESQLQALRLSEAHYRAGNISLTQVDKVRQDVESRRALLLQNTNAWITRFENYKSDVLGLPPNLPMELDDSFIRQFQFISPAIGKLQKNLSDFLDEFGEEPAEPEIKSLQRRFKQLAKLRKEVEQQTAVVAEDLKNVEKKAAVRLAEMKPGEQAKFTGDLRSLRETLPDLRRRTKGAEQKIAQVEAQLTPSSRKETADRLVQLVTEISNTVNEISLIQARARVEIISFKWETMDPDEALDVARANRLDWMNNRAALVDSWRLVQYNANKLRAGLDVVFSGDMSTIGNSPARFRAPTGTMRAGLKFDAPFTRLVERNDFRQAIIDYQQQRRQMIQFEDSVQENLRQLLRNIDLDKVNLEIQRRAATIAIRRVDETREVLNQPPPAPQPGQTASQIGPTAAMDHMDALNALTESQSNLMSVWLDYYANRMRLAREMGIMQLDDCGMWIDQPPSATARLSAEEAPLPPTPPDSWLKELEQVPAPPPQDEDSPPLPPKDPKRAEKPLAVQSRLR
jgi:hypothetical protein